MHVCTLLIVNQQNMYNKIVCSITLPCITIIWIIIWYYYRYISSILFNNLSAFFSRYRTKSISTIKDPPPTTKKTTKTILPRGGRAVGFPCRGLFLWSLLIRLCGLGLFVIFHLDLVFIFVLLLVFFLLFFFLLLFLFLWFAHRTL